MQERILDVCSSEAPEAEKIRSHIQNSRYDLCDERDVIILPNMWDLMIGDYEQSGLTIRIKLWSVPDSKAPVPDDDPSSKVPDNDAPAMNLIPIVQVLDSDGQAASVTPNSRVLVSENQSICIEKCRSIIDEEKQSINAETGGESSTGVKDDPAGPFVDGNLHWRCNFLYKLDEHNAKFQQIWEVEMKRSQAKAENKMLEFLLSESKAKLKKFHVSPDDNGATRSPSSCPRLDASARPSDGKNQMSLTHE